ncbi:MAG: Scaffold-type E3 ligase [Alyxoria varia]|nr:MAG: Scaffold-type E3 ligase [Alyxoria varia]
MPPAHTPQQKSAIIQFVECTSSDKRTADRILRQHNWQVASAADSFFRQSSGGSSSLSKSSRQEDKSKATKELSALFDKYRDDPRNSPNTISINGTQKYLTDIAVAPDDIRVLILSTIIDSPSLGTMGRPGFTAGWADVEGASYTTIKAQKSQLQSLSESTSINMPASMKNTKRKPEPFFRRVYKKTFVLALPEGQNVRAIPLEEATEYWRLLLGPKGFEWKEFSPSNFPWLDEYIGFLQDKWKKAINKDLWEQTLAFAEKSLEDPKMGFWSEDAAWPGVIDEFVGFVKEKRGGDGGQDGEAMEVDR